MKGKIRRMFTQFCVVAVLLTSVCLMSACKDASNDSGQPLYDGAQILADGTSEVLASEEMTEQEPEPPVFEVSETEKTFYKDWLTRNILDLVEKVEEAEYGFYDVDYDGVAELIVREPMHLYVLQKQNDEVVLLNEETRYMSLLPNGMIMKFEVAPDRHEYNFYTLEEGGYEVCRTLSRRDTAEGGYGKFASEEDERLIDGVAVSEDEWDEVLYEILLRYWDRYEKEDGGLETYDYYFAEVEFVRFMGGAPTGLTYATAEEAYQAFLNGECGAYLSDNYSDENVGYMTFVPMENHPYYLYEIINVLLNERWGGSTDATFADYYTYNVGTAYIDCGMDGKPELLLEFEKEEHEVKYILQYRDGQLYLCFAIDQVARSYVKFNEYGYITDSGSGGAHTHSGKALLVDADCGEHLIYKWFSQLEGEFLYASDESGTDNLVNEVLMNFCNEKEGCVDLYGFELAYYYINGKYYYMYCIDEEEEKENSDLADLRTAYEESGLDFYIYEDIKVLIDAERDKWGVPEPTDSSWVYPVTFEGYEYYEN